MRIVHKNFILNIEGKHYPYVAGDTLTKEHEEHPYAIFFSDLLHEEKPKKAKTEKTE